METECSGLCLWQLATGHWAQSIQTIPSHPSCFKTYFYIILQSTPESSRWCSSSRCSDKTLYVSPPPTHVTYPAHFICELITLIILGKQQKLWSISVCNFLQPPAKSFLLGSNIFFKIIFLKMSSLSSCETPAFTPMANIRQNHSCVFFLIYVFMMENAKMKYY